MLLLLQQQQPGVFHALLLQCGVGIYHITNRKGFVWPLAENQQDARMSQGDSVASAIGTVAFLLLLRLQYITMTVDLCVDWCLIACLLSLRTVLGSPCY